MFFCKLEFHTVKSSDYKDLDENLDKIFSLCVLLNSHILKFLMCRYLYEKL